MTDKTLEQTGSRTALQVNRSERAKVYETAKVERNTISYNVLNNIKKSQTRLADWGSVPRPPTGGPKFRPGQPKRYQSSHPWA